MATTFTSFPKLATELQDLIWEAAIKNYEPLTVKIRSILDKHNEHKPWNARWSTEHNSRGTRAPGMLSVCKNSRSIALKYFKLAFAGVDNNPIWFNFQTDILAAPRDLLFDIELPNFRNPLEIKLFNQNSLMRDFAHVEQVVEYSEHAGYHRMLQNRQDRRYKIFLKLERLGEKKGNRPLLWLK